MKFLPISNLSFVNSTSKPCGAMSMMPKRTASVPYSSNKSKGSGELPRDLLNFFPVSSLKIEVK